MPGYELNCIYHITLQDDVQFGLFIAHNPTSEPKGTFMAYSRYTGKASPVPDFSGRTDPEVRRLLKAVVLPRLDEIFARLARLAAKATGALEVRVPVFLDLYCQFAVGEDDEVLIHEVSGLLRQDAGAEWLRWNPADDVRLISPPDGEIRLLSLLADPDFTQELSLPALRDLFAAQPAEQAT